MKYTNSRNYPKEVVLGLTHHAYQKHGDISATGIMGPTRQTILKERHAEHIVQDVSEMVYANYAYLGC